MLTQTAARLWPFDGRTAPSLGAQIRSVVEFEATGVIVFGVEGNRFCKRIGRHHRANHIMVRTCVWVRVCCVFAHVHVCECRKGLGDKDGW